MMDQASLHKKWNYGKLQTAKKLLEWFTLDKKKWSLETSKYFSVYGSAVKDITAKLEMNGKLDFRSKEENKRNAHFDVGRSWIQRKKMEMKKKYWKIFGEEMERREMVRILEVLTDDAFMKHGIGGLKAKVNKTMSKLNLYGAGRRFRNQGARGWGGYGPNVQLVKLTFANGATVVLPAHSYRVMEKDGIFDRNGQVKPTVMGHPAQVTQTSGICPPTKTTTVDAAVKTVRTMDAVVQKDIPPKLKSVGTFDGTKPKMEILEAPVKTFVKPGEQRGASATGAPIPSLEFLHVLLTMWLIQAMALMIKGIWNYAGKAMNGFWNIRMELVMVTFLLAKAVSHKVEGGPAIRAVPLNGGGVGEIAKGEAFQAEGVRIDRRGKAEGIGGAHGAYKDGWFDLAPTHRCGGVSTDDNCQLWSSDGRRQM